MHHHIQDLDPLPIIHRIQKINKHLLKFNLLQDKMEKLTKQSIKQRCVKIGLKWEFAATGTNANSLMETENFWEKHHQSTIINTNLRLV